MEEENSENLVKLISNSIHSNESLQNVIEELKGFLINVLNNSQSTNSNIDNKIEELENYKTINHNVKLPPLPDYEIRKNLGLYIPKERMSRMWSRDEKIALIRGIRKELIQKRTHSTYLEFQAALKYPIYSKFKSHTINNFADLKKKYESMSIHDVIQEQNYKEELDWSEIAKVYLNNSHSKEECQNIWNLYLHPKFSKASWKPEEDEKLEVLVKKYHNQNWNAIANELNSGRSEYQCFMRHIALNKEKPKQPWTKEEREKLCKLREKFRYGSYSNWSAIMFFMPNRSRQELYKQWHLLKNEFLDKKPISTPFTIAEDLTLLAAARIVGDRYIKLAKYLPHRKVSQVRSHWERLRKLRLPLKFTKNDFKDLWILMQRYSLCPNKVYGHFYYMKYHQLRSRIRYLEKKSKEENFQIDNLPISTKLKLAFFLNLEKSREIARVHPNPDDLYKRISLVLKKKSDKKSFLVKKKKRKGRPSTDKDPVARGFHEFFRMTYQQPRGRLKINLSEQDEIQAKYSTEMWIRFLKSKLNLSNLSETDYEKQRLDNLILSNLPTISDSDSDFLHFIPPALSNLVGFRTLLLSQRHFCHNHISNESNEKKKQITYEAKKAKELLFKRMLSLFLGPAIVSRFEPKINLEKTPNKSISTNIEVKEDLSILNQENDESPKKKKIKMRPGKKRAVPHAAHEARREMYKKKLEEQGVEYQIKQKEPKRAYVRTGKFKKTVEPISEVRRSSRNKN